MQRRSLLRSAAATGLSSLFSPTGSTSASAKPMSPTPPRPGEKIRGVNLGGWLALEKWITPSVYAGVKAEDEYTLCQVLGKEKATARLAEHRKKWITAKDFEFLAGCGLNAVRLPVHYGIAEDNPPFITGWDTVDWAFRTARSHGMGVLLDLHGAPGSQNGMDHSGRSGAVGWPNNPANIAHTLDIIEDLARRCKGYDNLIGIELLNEPRWDVPITILKSYYQDAYARVRKHIPKDRGLVVIHDGFRGFEWKGFMQEPDYSNVVLDTHMYQCFTQEDHKRDIYAQLEVAALERKRQLDGMRQQLWCMVGEWSVALPPESLEGLTGFRRDTALRAYGAAQLTAFETSQGWFYWTYKIESGGPWSFRDCVERGWLPDKYA